MAPFLSVGEDIILGGEAASYYFGLRVNEHSIRPPFLSTSLMEKRVSQTEASELRKRLKLVNQTREKSMADLVPALADLKTQI